MKMTITRAMMVAMLFAAGTTACSRSEPDADVDTVENTVVDNYDAVDTPPVEAEPSPLPTIAPDANMAEALPPAEEPKPDEQMLDDASATGMTSRASRDEEAAATNAN